MALPPILNFGSDYLKQMVIREVVTVRWLCFLEPIY